MRFHFASQMAISTCQVPVKGDAMGKEARIGLLLGASERRRIFNLGYYTWVEQQGVSVEDFDRRKDQGFWRGIAGSAREWDRLITEFNGEVGIN